MSWPAEFLLLWTSYRAEFLAGLDVIPCRISAALEIKACRIFAALEVKACRISVVPCRISAALDATSCRIFVALDVKPCRVSALQFVIPCQIKMKKKKNPRTLRVKIKDFIVPLLHVQSIMCTLIRVYNQRSRKLNICISKMHLRLTFRWIIHNVALLKQQIFLIRESWSILLLLHRRNFRVFCLNRAALQPTFHFVWKKHDILRNRYEKHG